MTELKRCVIATRESPLAMWQALHVQALLRNRYPEMDVQILGMTTKGDQILDKTLSKIGGKGLFVKELEAAMLEGQADLAVHSLKDVPMQLPEGFTLAAVSSREDPRDAFVSPKYARLEDMPAGARVGTASLRRELMLRSEFPHLTVLPIRGNVGTRLSKLDNGDFDALVMAGAGLKRLKLEDRIRELLPVETSLPAPGQGALGVEVRADRKDLLELLAMNPGKVYSRENLLNIVWGYEYPGDARTVDVHIRRLREKIETNPSDPKYVYTKWGVGYYFRG